MATSEAPEPRGRLRALLQDAVDRRIAPGAVAEVGSAEGVLWREAFGSLTGDAGAVAVDDSTIFDLASLTKPIATTSLVLGLAARRVLTLHDPIAPTSPSGPENGARRSPCRTCSNMRRVCRQG
jgi:CubicO group peptidase (beta-lactamase class C family)